MNILALFLFVSGYDDDVRIVKRSSMIALGNYCLLDRVMRKSVFAYKKKQNNYMEGSGSATIK